MSGVPEPSVAVGTIVADRYRMGLRLGVGGMGEVYEAQHLDTQVTVAIKLLRESASETIVERFEREGKALAQMKSEHVIRVFDVGVLASGRPYIVMERLHGSDLAVIKKQRGTLNVATAVRYVLQACVGIAEAHGLGIVHRDLKPANLYVAEVADDRTVTKVLDFGISKVNAAAKAGKTGLTEAGDVFGSPRYMPPEQLRDTRDVDARADIWSLGVTLAELVTGTTPFHADDFGTLMFNILGEEPPSMTHVGQAFDAAVRRSLAKNRDERFQTVVDFAAALAPLLDEGPALAARVSATFADARARARSLAGRAAPQVTRLLPAVDKPQETAVLRISLNPIAPTLTHLPAAAPPAPPKSRWWLGLGALLLVVVGGVAAWAVFGPKNTVEATEEDEREPRKRRSKSAPVPTAEASAARRLAPDVASQPTYRIAPEIVGLLNDDSIAVRDLMFFDQRAVLLVSSKRGLERYDYAQGALSEPTAAQATSGARLSALLPLADVDLSKVAAMASDAERRFGAGKLHSLGLQWLLDEVLWIASSTDGQSSYYRLDGSARPQ